MSNADTTKKQPPRYEGDKGRVEEQHAQAPAAPQEAGERAQTQPAATTEGETGAKNSAPNKKARKKNAGKKGGGQKGSRNQGKRKKGKGKKKRDQEAFSVERGKTKRAAYDVNVLAYTQPGLRTLEETVRPATLQYRDICAALSQNGFSAAIGEINDAINAHTDKAIRFAEKTKAKMETCIDRHIESLGVEISMRDLGEPHRVSITSIGGVTSRLIRLATAFDEAVIKCDAAYSIDAVPHRESWNAVSAMISHNRAVLKAVTTIGAHVRKRLPEPKISLDELQAYLREHGDDDAGQQTEAGEDRKPESRTDAEGDRESVTEGNPPPQKREGEAEHAPVEPPSKAAGVLKRVLGSGQK